MSELSLITVTYQSAENVTDFLRAARVAAPDAEVIVVDNASSDGTPDLVERTDSSVEVVRLDCNPGFGRSCNTGAYQARGSWLLFANPDVRIRAISLPELVAGEGFGLGGGQLTGRADNGASPSLRAETGLIEDWLRAVMGRFVPPSVYNRIPIREQPVGWACGGLLLARREEYLSVGGFDPRYFMYFEDRDLGARYRLAGFPVRGVAGLEGMHLHGASSSGVVGWQKEVWALTSWLEYVGIWQGQPTANRAALAAVAALKGMTQAGTLASHWGRLRRKVDQVDSILEFAGTLTSRLPMGDASYYPHAAQALEKALHSSNLSLWRGERLSG